jgi:hypothetical protein
VSKRPTPRQFTLKPDHHWPGFSFFDIKASNLGWKYRVSEAHTVDCASIRLI